MSRGHDEEQRVDPRHPAGWFGRYRLDRPRRGGWQPCVVHDVSLRGVGVEVRDSLVDVTDTVVVDLQVRNADLAGIVLQGDVRYVRPDGGGMSRVGIEFTRATPLERWTLERLMQLHQARVGPSRATEFNKVTLEGPCVRLHCRRCDLVLGVIAPHGEHDITAAFNHNADDLMPALHQGLAQLGDEFIVDTPRDFSGVWDLPAVLAAWCPRCRRECTTGLHDVVGPIARTRATGEGEDVTAFA